MKLRLIYNMKSFLEKKKSCEQPKALQQEGDFHAEMPFPRKHEALNPSDKENDSAESSNNENDSKGGTTTGRKHVYLLTFFFSSL